MAVRIPKVELAAEVLENMIKQVGEVPEPLEVTFINTDWKILCSVRR
jgi:hypothetical protein